MQFDALLHPTPKGLYCPPGDFYVDPVAPVARAVVTHGHADHARAGHGAVLATPETIAIMGARYGEAFTPGPQSARYHDRTAINDVNVTLVPAGHVLGSAQAVIESGGTRIVVSGDYKRREDPTCPPFEVVPCDVFISEATFALPVFKHPETGGEIRKLLASVKQFPERTHVIGAYALGKAQRIICELRREGYDDAVFIHGALQKLCGLYEAHGVSLGPLEPATIENRGAKQEFAGRIVIAPPSAIQDRWARRFADPLPVFASGWMRIRQRTRQRGVELPLIISDHADWDELTGTIREIGPEELWITHGREDALMRWAELEGMKARPLRLVGYDDENE
ncbi:ligase-associated DNA damage response exonuclease [Hyphococcus sp.]|uniref:ligase-associated DNA damage response exonuclease n=1 Tax=Hyphococcus sp. TaxID=2038636 RepID=UPI003CCBCAC6